MTHRPQSTPALILSLCLLAGSSAVAEPPQLIQRMFGGARPMADAGSGSQLTQEDGPWLILAHTFVGENSKEKADRLVAELKKELNLPAYVYYQKFDFTQEPETADADIRRVRYANPHAYEAYAVLVGEYDSTDHPNAERDLKRIKSAKPSIFADKKVIEEETNKMNPITAIKAVHQKWASSDKTETRGPMFNAFMTRNPMLPPEYFASPRVDQFVQDLNEGLPHSLLDCPGKFTVTVRTFEGYGMIANGKDDDRFQPNQERLDKCAEDAANMCAKLRKKGVEAYQFHDRSRSIVTVGSFTTLGQEQPDGGFTYAPDILRVIDQYRAFNVQPELAKQVPLDKGVAANNIDNVPFDVQPVPIAVPQRAKRSLYKR